MMRADLGFINVVDLALGAYARRSKLYLAAALAAFAGVAVCASAFGGNVSAVTCATLLALAPLNALVAIGTANDVRGETLGTRELLKLAWRKTLLVFVVDFITWPIGSLAIEILVDGPGSSALLFLPALLLWGAYSFTDAIVAIDPVHGPKAPFIALATSIRLSLRKENLSRIFLLALVQIPPALLESMLDDYYRTHHVAQHLFWAATPLAILIAGPYEALFAVFYLHLMQRDLA